MTDGAVTDICSGCTFTRVGWMTAARDGTLYLIDGIDVRRIAPELLPDSEQNFHRRVYLHRVGTSPDDDVLVFGAGMTMTNYYGVEVSRDGHWLQVSASEGTEPRNDLWLADLTTSPHESPAPAPKGWCRSTPTNNFPCCTPPARVPAPRLLC